jgi:hypothetical protein
MLALSYLCLPCSRCVYLLYMRLVCTLAPSACTCQLARSCQPAARAARAAPRVDHVDKTVKRRQSGGGQAALTVIYYVNVNLRAEVDCLVHVRAENVSLRAEVHRAREQVKRSAQSVLVELDATSTSCETMQARAEHEQQLKLQQSQLQHERRTGPVPKPTSLHWAQWRE